MAPPVSSQALSPRGEAARIVSSWLRTGSFPDREIDAVTESHGAVLELVQGVVRWKRLLEEVRTVLVPRKPRAEIDAFLLVGLYQLLRMENMPAHAAVHETVEAAKAVGGKKTADFVNAVLRRVTKERAALASKIDAFPWPVRLSHPDALAMRWKRAFGEQAAQDLCAWNNRAPDVVLRVVKTRKDLAGFLQALEQAGVRAEPHAARPDDCVVLSHGVRVRDVPGYEEGWFAVQDPSTLAAPELLDPQPGETVLDACAAPGGKTAILSSRAGDRGRVIASDRHADRLGPLRDNVRRLALANVTVATCDATDAVALRRLADEHAPAGFDRILLDVPCSNTGVIRRRPDARWRFSVERLDRTVALQRALLDAASQVLKPGSALVYSTCSLEPEENEDQIRAWLTAHPAFRLEREVKLVPPASGTDGAYAALLLTS
ncbi:MAG TPA: 16S rRNA (cytosine(967)-C(5))-methyltransferase RsmB [Kiritimatiellia bacterium]|jgi:16S rRNA (cytosine967-C5)-methyltransferase